MTFADSLQTNIVKEEIKKPLLSKERIMYWLTSFKSGDIQCFGFVLIVEGIE